MEQTNKQRNVFSRFISATLAFMLDFLGLVLLFVMEYIDDLDYSGKLHRFRNLLEVLTLLLGVVLIMMIMVPSIGLGWPFFLISVPFWTCVALMIYCDKRLGTYPD